MFSNNQIVFFVSLSFVIFQICSSTTTISADPWDEMSKNRRTEDNKNTTIKSVCDGKFIQLYNNSQIRHDQHELNISWNSLSKSGKNLTISISPENGNCVKIRKQKYSVQENEPKTIQISLENGCLYKITYELLDDSNNIICEEQHDILMPATDSEMIEHSSNSTKYLDHESYENECNKTFVEHKKIQKNSKEGYSLNVSWIEISEKVDHLIISLENSTNEDCEISDQEFFLNRMESYVVIPTNPKLLKHNCTYIIKYKVLNEQNNVICNNKTFRKSKKGQTKKKISQKSKVSNDVCNGKFIQIKNITMRFNRDVEKLNISWTNLKEGRILEVSIVSLSSSNKCLNGTQSSKDVKDNHLIVPVKDSSNSEDVKPCSYNITYQVRVEKSGVNLCKEVVHYSYEECTNFKTMQVDYLTDLQIQPFVDENKYVRFNLSWSGYRAHTTIDYVDITIKSTNKNAGGEKCSTFEEISHHIEAGYIIVPNELIEHPGTSITLGCNYTVTFMEQMNACVRRQHKTQYRVPDCVDKTCVCEAVDNYNITSVTKIKDFVYLIKWNATDLMDAPTDIKAQYYVTDFNSTVVNVSVDENPNANDSAIVTFDHLHSGTSYTIDIKFTYDNCEFRSLHTFYVPDEGSTIVFLTVLALLVLTLFCLYLIIKSRYFVKIARYFPCLPQHSVQDLRFPLKTMRQEVNPLYDPIDFNYEKYDKYEIPRNKIQIKHELGKGQFGKVFFAKAYGINGCKSLLVAVKQINAGTESTQLNDFKAEIEILKNIGEHPNVIKLLGCCTREYPCLMVMELASGALKNYLINVREFWNQRKPKGNRFFFPDDMDFSHFGSYINPETPWCPNGPGTPKFRCTKTAKGWVQFVSNTPPLNGQKPSSISVIQENDHSSPTFSIRSKGETLSETSSRLPSTTETILTECTTPTTYIPSNESEMPLIHLTPNATNESDVQTPTSPQIYSLTPQLDHTELHNFALQIARGMEFLESKTVVHRDLAARNILITSDKILKISDFGMSKAGPYVSQTKKPMPLRWMAIEAIESAECTCKSDVWSFGVVLWEIGTLGAYPYEKIDNHMLLPQLKKGRRLERPEICTDEIYNVMQQCWSENPEQRPSFKELVDILDKRKIYVDFKQISPSYVFPPVCDDRVEEHSSSNNFNSDLTCS